jgi:hypothetical protein
VSSNECHYSGARVFWMVSAAPISATFQCKSANISRFSTSRFGFDTGIDYSPLLVC